MLKNQTRVRTSSSLDQILQLLIGAELGNQAGEMNSKTHACSVFGREITRSCWDESAEPERGDLNFGVHAGTKVDKGNYSHFLPDVRSPAGSTSAGSDMRALFREGR